MGIRFNNTEEFNTEFEFELGRNIYMAEVSFEIRSSGEYPSYDYPGDSESDIENLEIEMLEVWNDDIDQWVAVGSNEEIEDFILDHIQQKYL